MTLKHKESWLILLENHSEIPFENSSTDFFWKYIRISCMDCFRISSGISYDIFVRENFYKKSNEEVSLKYSSIDFFIRNPLKNWKSLPRIHRRFYKFFQRFFYKFYWRFLQKRSGVFSSHKLIPAFSKNFCISFWVHFYWFLLILDEE